MADGAGEALWRVQREAVRRVTDTWMQVLRSASALTPGSVQDVQEQMLELVRTVTEYGGAAVRPLRGLVQGQRDFADRMMRWAELQRELADQVASWARHQRDLADSVDRWLAPFSPTAPPEHGA